MNPIFFPDQNDFRLWLGDNHETAAEIIVGFYNIKSGKGGMTWSEAVDQALCFGWIDSVRQKIDDESYCNRFTPRRPNSNWSTVNIKKVEELTANGLMRAAGIAAFEKRREDKTAVYSYENKPTEFPPKHEKVFRKNKKAWKFFNDQPTGYKRLMMYWIMSAKQEKTQLSRLEKLIIASSTEQRIQ